jgi:hypothetical protein
MSSFEKWMFWKDTGCANGIVDYLEMYPMYDVGKWSDWKGA